MNSAQPPLVSAPRGDVAMDNQTVRLEASIIEAARQRSRDAARPLTDLLEATRTLLAAEGFTVQSLLGKGGNGIVFLAHDERLGRPVAIKAMLPEPGGSSTAEERTSFLREAQLLAQFAHENIVQVFTILEAGGLAFILMEYVEGESLAGLVGRRGPLPEREALLLLVGMLRGIEAAHRAGLLHRDIKPENILLTRGGIPKVADFGLAAHRPEALLDVGTVVGTPSFMAPEQAAGRAVSPRTDLYSAGLCLYFMLTGQRPHGGARSSAEVLERAAQGRLEPVERLRPDASAAARALLKRALEADPVMRFLDAAQFREACEAALLSGGYRPRGARRARAALRWGALAALPLVSAGAGWLMARDAVHSAEQDWMRSQRVRIEETVRDLDAALLLAQQAGRETTQVAALRQALASMAGEGGNPRTAADLLARGEMEVLRADILRLAEQAQPPLGPGARARIESLVASGAPGDLWKLRRTLLYAPERLDSAASPGRSEKHD